MHSRNTIEVKFQNSKSLKPNVINSFQKFCSYIHMILYSFQLYGFLQKAGQSVYVLYI